ncbi:MAG TPA: nucleotidyltransferase [Acidimicrobiales bacterium]|nr:nucleotidyltransferase [Acidimicrobiales bacterium]
MGSHYPEGEEPTDEDLQATFADTVEALAAAEVPYLLIGGLSASAFARPRITDDIDVFVRPDMARKVLHALAAAGFETEETDDRWLFKAFKRGVLVDVIFRSSGDVYLDDEMLERADMQEHWGVTAPLISPEDLLVIKAVATTEHGSHHWYDALAVIARCPLDWAYLMRRARQAGPRRVLSLLLYAESNDLAVPAEVIEALFEVVHPQLKDSLDVPAPNGRTPKEEART